MDGPSCVVSTDPAPSCAALQNDETWHQYQISLEVERIKTLTKIKLLKRLFKK